MWRTLTTRLGPGLLRDIALVCAADGLVGASFGAITVGSGLPLWLPMLMSVVVFAGAAQFMFVGLVASGGNPIAAVLAGLLVNARHLPFGFAVGDVFGRGLARRAVGAHLMIDETVAFALAQRDADRRRTAFWVCGIMLFVCWNVGAVAGAFGGTVISDTDAFGLDAAFPAVLLALVLPSLKDRATRLAVAVGVAVALATSPLLPAGVPVLLALAGVLVTLGAAPDPPRDGSRDPAAAPPARSEDAT
ncbi:4-azaleucine resistance probable transporter AzlC [Prauserella aidingensis]|nr:4-azaleucine resistance probable transporter AzlC [Prauserella aidingensis]